MDAPADGPVSDGASRDDTDELFLIRVENSRFRHETLVAGVEWWNDPAALDGW